MLGVFRRCPTGYTQRAQATHNLFLHRPACRPDMRIIQHPAQRQKEAKRTGRPLIYSSNLRHKPAWRLDYMTDSL
jgi:hypothetical protein